MFTSGQCGLIIQYRPGRAEEEGRFVFRLLLMSSGALLGCLMLWDC